MQNCLSNSSVKRGFTLIEMLVVIGIIALLAAILFPVFGKVREGARKTSCMNNMRQLGLAFQQYQTDYHRYPLPGQYQKWADGAHWVTGGETLDNKPKDYPSSANGGLALGASPFTYVSGRQAYVEQGALFPYVKEDAAYICPSAPNNNDKKLSYSMNCAVAGLGEQRLRKPAEIALLVDEGDTINDGYFWATSNSGSTDALMKTHNGGGNVLFTDGHVKFYTFQELPIDGTPAGQAIKGALTGTVRFLDSGFGPKGASVIPAMQDVPASPPTTDSCGSTL
jgi:prepilin-type N-terminal cleavage/methylation domain-containing protein/prepilin-type processing-associated H-X9-DG protein